MTNDTSSSSTGTAVVIRRLIDGFRGTQALFVAADLGIADHLVAGPLSVTELAARTAADADALRRLMRTLCALGVFSEQSSGRFGLNPVSQLLRNDVEGSFRAVVQLLAGPARWRCWASLGETIKTGEGAAERILGASLFDYYAGNSPLSKIHDDAMQTLSATHGAAVIEAIALRDGDVVVDVGGGTGQLLAASLLLNPTTKGVLFDLPNVVLHAPALLHANNVSDRCAVEGGSFFERAPDGGDVYLLKQVIHDWDDERATMILRSCRRCMPQQARLLVIERQMPEPSAAQASTEPFLLDLEMLVMTSGGRERTKTEFRTLFANAGFVLRNVAQTASPLYVFEAHPN